MVTQGGNPKAGQSMKPLTEAKPGGVESTNPSGIPPKGIRNQDEVPRGGGSIKGVDGQFSRGGRTKGKSQ